MKGRKHTPEQIVRKLREGERLVAEGKSVAEVAQGARDQRATPTCAGATSTGA